MDSKGGKGQYALRRLCPQDSDGQRFEQGKSPRFLLQGSPQACGDDGEYDSSLFGDPVQLQQMSRPPFERWTQDQYYEMAAYFAQFKLEKDPASGKSEIGKTAVERGKPLYEFVKDVKSGEMKHELTGEITAPAFPYPAKHEISKDASRRKNWLPG